ncbi:hypothetical protein BY458DRAFT_524159 [Sporodiniella umbellata]|nr:hypothetical protein BY458DRAFT_524159 [Sporodiniella umbellata]
MENKAPTPNFSSKNSEIEYFRYAPVSKWDFESFKEHTMKKRSKPKPVSIYIKYKHCLHTLARLSDLSEEKTQVLEKLTQDCETLSPQEKQQQQRSPETNYYNYGTVGFLGDMCSGTLNVIPSKRVLEETEEMPRSNQRSESPESLSAGEPEPTSFLTDTTDESFELTEPSSNYGELFKQRRYILELNEFDDITLASKVSARNMDNDLSLDERLFLSSIKCYENCPVEITLQPYAFSDQTYTEIRKWRRSKLAKTEYFPSQFTPNDPSTEEDIFQRNLGVFLVSLTETLDRLPLISRSKHSEIDYLVQNISILLRFVFNSKSEINVAWERPSMTNKDTGGKTVTHDFLIYSNNQELGCGEVKIDGVGERLQEEDRARLGERLKKQLHYRIKEAKSIREFYVFGVFVVGNTMELYRSSFSKKNGYDFVLLRKIALPTLKSTYTSIEDSLEILFSFKESIIKTMQDPSECERPYIYREYYKYLKPTVSFI